MGKVAFVLSGGAAKGSFQVGVLNYLMGEKKIIPDMVFGISTGSLQSFCVAQHDLEVLNDLWKSVTKRSDICSTSIYRILGLVFGYSNGLLELKGLRKILEKYFDKEKIKNSTTSIFVGTVNMQTAKLEYWDRNTIDIDKILASCTIPIIFPPIKSGEYQLVDGGVRDIVPLKKAIQEGADTIYVVPCMPLNLTAENKKYKSITSVILRAIDDIMKNETMLNDVNVLKFKNELRGKSDYYKNKYRHIECKIIDPSRHFIDELQFEHKAILDGIQHGYERAKEVVG
ncbi:MAG: patatin-like phospholipase family protein [Elusimicrobia bacterium]|nr:patatin-like phospholipase family protein [Elusimicrobiota bacterium]